MKAKTKTQRKKPKQSQVEAAIEVPPEEQVGFEETVTKINQSHTTFALAMGRAAHYVKPEYGEATLARLAERVGVSYETLKRVRGVYRKYPDVDFGATSPSFGAMAALQDHPDRVALLRATPGMTVEKAREIASEYRAANPKKANTTANTTASVQQVISGPITPNPLYAGNNIANPDPTEPVAETGAAEAASVEPEPEPEDESVTLDSAEVDFRTKFQDRPHARDDRGFILKVRELTHTAIVEFGKHLQGVDADILRDVLEEDLEQEIHKMRRVADHLSWMANDWEEKFTPLADAAE